MRTELLIILPDNESFCSNKRAFIDFLKVDSLISISGQKVSYHRAPKSKELVSARFRVETEKVKSKQERYFLLTLECSTEAQVDEFNELCDRIRTIGGRLSPGLTNINTIWDDVGRIYAEKSYPLINEVENLLRRLIAKFMLINVGVNWSKDTIHPDLFKKIEKFDDPEPYVNDLYKLDFIHLKQVLFEKKRDISLEELDRVLSQTTFIDDDKEKIKKYIPRSNWEKYFSELIEVRDKDFEKKWDILYKLRNKVAHNRHVKKEEFEKIKGLTSEIKSIIQKASTKLGEIDLNENDRDLIIDSYTWDYRFSFPTIAEKAVADFYSKSGYEVASLPFGPVDFLATKDGNNIAIEVKAISPISFAHIVKSTAKLIKSKIQQGEFISFSKINIVIVLRDLDDERYPINTILKRAVSLKELLGNEFEIQIGILNEEEIFIPFDIHKE